MRFPQAQGGGGLANQDGFGADDDLRRLDIVVLVAGLQGRVFLRAHQPQAGALDHAGQGGRVGAQHQDVLCEQAPMRLRDIAVAVLADDGGDRDLSLRRGFQIGHRLADQVRGGGQGGLDRIVLDRKAPVGGGLGAAVRRQQPPADAQEQDGDDRQRQADGRVVEQMIRFTGHRSPDFRDQHIRRRPDLRHRPADQRPEGQRHQIAGNRPVARPGGLDRDGQEDAQHAHVLDEGGQERDRGRQQPNLQRRGADPVHRPPHPLIHNPRHRHRSADHQGRGDDDHDRTGKAGKHLGRRHHAQQGGG